MSDAQAAVSVCAWNVNGARAALKKGFGDWWRGTWQPSPSRGRPLAVGLQEVRAKPEQLPEPLFPGATWSHLQPAERPGYSGVALACDREPRAVETALGQEAIDREGRVQIADFGKLSIANIYFPNGNGKNRSNDRVPFKLEFYQALEAALWRRVEADQHVIVMGDFNTAHTPIDLARPKANERTSGFLPEERQELDRWLAKGWVDTFRARCKEPGHYSWWSQRQGARARNVGWRIDYVLCAPHTARWLIDAGIDAQVMGSDHCPVWASFDPRIVD